MSTIEETVISALPSGARTEHPHEVSAVLDALIERERALTETITRAVVDHFGVSFGQVRAQLESIGMAVRPAPAPWSTLPTVLHPTMQEFEDLMKGDTLSATEREADRNAAESRAFIGTEKLKKGGKKSLAKRVRKLEKLAERHGLTV